MDLAKEVRIGLGAAVAVTGTLGVLAALDYDLTRNVKARQAYYRFEQWHAVAGLLLALLVFYVRTT